MLEVNLICCSGAAALTGHDLVKMRPHDGLCSISKLFITAGRQMVPIAGTADFVQETC